MRQTQRKSESRGKTYHFKETKQKPNYIGWKKSFYPRPLVYTASPFQTLRFAFLFLWLSKRYLIGSFVSVDSFLNAFPRWKMRKRMDIVTQDLNWKGKVHSIIYSLSVCYFERMQFTYILGQHNAILNLTFVVNKIKSCNFINDIFNLFCSRLKSYDYECENY